MRADRLLMLLTLLQTKGRVTAQSLAKRLEVSERTIYRDLEALSMAGVPVYAERGPGGGWLLMEDYRTNLNKLTQAEVNTLFMSSAAGPLVDLGLGKAREDALLKLLASLPTVYRRNAEVARQRIHLDSTGWFRRGEDVPCLQIIQEAVWNDRCLLIRHLRGEEGLVERLVHPYGLVAKTNIWYLVAAIVESEGEMRVFRVSRLHSAELVEESFHRPEDFDLPAFWQRWITDFEQSLQRCPVTFRVAPQATFALYPVFGNSISTLLKQADPPDEQGWITLTVLCESYSDARSKLLGLGAQVEVLEPQELRESMAEAARQIAALYAK